MDAFAVSICKGLNMRKLDVKQTALIALFFGGFQAGMPLVGWFIGSKFADYITSIEFGFKLLTKSEVCGTISTINI